MKIKNKQFSKSEIREAKNELEKIYKPAVLKTKKNIQDYKKQIDQILEEYENFKKKYYYFYNKLKKL